MHEFFYYSVEAEEHLRYALIHCDIEKLEMLGEKYIFDIANEHAHDTLYRTYITDSLRLLANIGGYLGHVDISIPRYYDLLHPEAAEPERTAEEIVEDVLTRAGITIIGGEEDER